MAVVAIHAALLFAFLNIAGKISLGETQSVLRVFDINALKAPPPPPPPQQKTQPKPKAKEGGSAPRNIKSEATPVVAPKPKIPAPPTVAATETPRQGVEPTQGASSVRGPGTGAGGIGTGTGSGAGGTGPGGGGGGVAEPPHLLTGVLNGRDFPAAIERNWPRGAVIFIRLRIELERTSQSVRRDALLWRCNGRPMDVCAIDAGRRVSARVGRARRAGCLMGRLQAGRHQPLKSD